MAHGAYTHDLGQCIPLRPAPSRGEYRAGGRVHMPSRVAPPVGRHQLPQGSSIYLPPRACMPSSLTQGYWYEMAVVVVDGRVEASDDGAWQGEHGCGHWINAASLVDGLVNPAAAITTCDTFATEYTELLQLSQQGDDSPSHASLSIPGGCVVRCVCAFVWRPTATSRQAKKMN